MVVVVTSLAAKTFLLVLFIIPDYPHNIYFVEAQIQLKHHQFEMDVYYYFNYRMQLPHALQFICSALTKFQFRRPG